MALTHNVLNRVPFSLGNGADNALTAYARNNRFRGFPSDDFWWSCVTIWPRQPVAADVNVRAPSVRRWSRQFVAVDGDVRAPKGGHAFSTGRGPSGPRPGPHSNAWAGWS
ncbi:MAG: hypothetical protein IPM17_06745 [Verrucomicrobia bacterium]|nr:hypothetical protein [Verrucomicrobiota bacterium]